MKMHKDYRPVHIYSPLYMIEIKASKRSTIALGSALFGESALYILEGNVFSEENSFEPKHILIAKNSKLSEFELEAGSTIYLFGGDAFPEERYIYWNFVASDLALIVKVKADRKVQAFPQVSGKTEFVPLPKF